MDAMTTSPLTTAPVDLEHEFAKHLRVIARELSAMSKLYDEYELPGDFLRDRYPFSDELDELVAMVSGAAEELGEPECGDYPAPCNHDDAEHTIRLGSNGQPV